MTKYKEEPVQQFNLACFFRAPRIGIWWRRPWTVNSEQGNEHLIPGWHEPIANNTTLRRSGEIDNNCRHSPHCLVHHPGQSSRQRCPCHQNSSNNNNDAFDNPDCDQILTETLAPTQCVSRSHNSSQALGTRPSVLPGRAHMTWQIHQLPGRNSGCFRPTHWPLTIFTRRIIPTTSKVELNHHWALSWIITIIKSFPNLSDYTLVCFWEGLKKK